MTRFRHGLLIGKFYPPHRGHHAAIREGAAACDRFTVVVMSSAGETVPLADRVAWLRAEHTTDANVRVTGIPCDAPLDVDDPQVWGLKTMCWNALNPESCSFCKLVSGIWASRGFWEL